MKKDKQSDTRGGVASLCELYACCLDAPGTLSRLCHSLCGLYDESDWQEEPETGAKKPRISLHHYNCGGIAYELQREDDDADIEIVGVATLESSKSPRSACGDARRLDSDFLHAYLINSSASMIPPFGAAALSFLRESLSLFTRQQRDHTDEVSQDREMLFKAFCGTCAQMSARCPIASLTRGPSDSHSNNAWSRLLAEGFLSMDPTVIDAEERSCGVPFSIRVEARGLGVPGTLALVTRQLLLRSAPSRLRKVIDGYSHSDERGPALPDLGSAPVSMAADIAHVSNDQCNAKIYNSKRFMLRILTESDLLSMARKRFGSSFGSKPGQDDSLLVLQAANWVEDIVRRVELRAFSKESSDKVGEYAEMLQQMLDQGSKKSTYVIDKDSAGTRCEDASFIILRKDRNS